MKRTFVIGDIHGCYDELIELIDQIGLRDEDWLVSVGDILDRGGKSRDVYHYFKNRPNAKVLIGNHERKHLKRILSYSQEIVKVQFAEEYPSLLQWLRGLDYYFESDEAIIVHAAFEHDRSLDEQKEAVLTGSVSGEAYLQRKYGPGTHWSDYYAGEKAVIYGHRVVGDEPLIKNNTYGLDTGACHGGYLTAIELPGFVIHRVKSHADHWKLEKRAWQVPVLKARDWGNMEISAIEKQMTKFDQINQEDVKAFFASLKTQLNSLDAALVAINERIHDLTADLSAAHGDDFNKIASQFKHGILLIRCRKNILRENEPRKQLNTPKKIVAMARQLGIFLTFGPVASGS
ncbi:MAG: metallophosphoesterase [Methylococcales bacterium]